MNLLVNVILFVIVLLFYLNLIQEYKMGQDLDVFEMDYQNVEQLNKMCQNKQPVVFRMDQGIVIPDSHFINTINPILLAEKYGKEDVFLSSLNKHGEPDEEPIAVPLKSAVLVQQDRIFENNHDFIMDLPIHHYYQSIDPFLKPFGTIQTEYDFVFGFTTTLRHHQHHSFFVYAVGGDLDVKLTPYKNIVAGKQHSFDGYIYPDLYQNKQSLLNCWTYFDKEEVEEEEENPEDITFLTISIPTGYCLFIPPYWWYSIRQTEPGQGGWMAIFKYDTVMGKVVHFIEQFKKWIFPSRNSYYPKAKEYEMEEYEEEFPEEEKEEEPAKEKILLEMDE